MSSGMLKGMEGLPRGEDQESYAPGSPGFDPLLIREVMGLYEQGPDLRGFIDEIRNRIHKEAPGADSAPAAAGYIALIIDDARQGWEFSDARERIGAMLGRDEGSIAHADSFIAAAIDLMADAGSAGNRYADDIFIDAIVQALYDHGHNEFRVDLRPLHERGERRSAGCRLAGSDGAPLRASYAGESLDFFGWEVSHCELVFDGSADFVGHASERSVLSLGGKLGVMTFGYDSRQCRYHFRGHPKIITVGGYASENEFHLLPDGSEGQEPESVALASDWTLSALRGSGFFERGNRLFFHYADSTHEVAR